MNASAARSSSPEASGRRPPRPAPSRLADLLTLAKIRLNSLVVFTSGAGYYMAVRERVDVAAMIAACLGTALVASGAAALNQVAEGDVDCLMARTHDRPVASRRMTPGTGRLVGLSLAALGVGLLGIETGVLSAALALATLVIYVAIYTPFKRISSLATVVGAIPGALPPLIGWVAAGGSLAAPGAWALFAIMFFWQLPHFLAISWLYREDYARAGLPMLAVIDTRGAMTGRQAVVWSVALLPATLVPAALGMVGSTYAVGAFVLGLIFIGLASQFAMRRSRSSARLLFLSSIVYLPLLWILMAAGRR